MRAIGKKETRRMFGRLKERFGRKKQPTVSYNRIEEYNRCRSNIMRVHHLVIVASGEEREVGLEDAVISSAAIDGLCDRIMDCPDWFSKAAVAIDYIANFHPFVEGNKRTALQIAIRLLRNGGYELDDDDETYLFIRDVASGMYDREEIEDWLRCNTHISSL
ncbi:type II toxin-antitoxin system death-on-curing family toxin [Methanomethylophilus alvi]|uniref:type II toxin-antitoxin system death-on-curing family toxin n=1 Tax=Methanomethylophilus alvi TaxID=1291540 RepID=UPI0037DBFA77